MLTPEIIEKLAKKYHLQVGQTVKMPDGSKGRLVNVRFDPDVGVVQFLGADNIFYNRGFRLEELKQPE